MLRWVLIVLCGAAFFFCLVAFEGARQADGAMAAIAHSRALEPPLRVRALTAASERLEQSWARPLAWNARAADALSAIYANQWEVTGEQRFGAMSVAAAMSALRLAPAEARTWVRLAHLAYRRAPATPCTVEECLERSWRLAPIIDAQTDCARLQLWRAAELPPEPIRGRLITFAQSGAGVSNVRDCLAFLPANERFEYLVAAQSALARLQAPERARRP